MNKNILDECAVIIRSTGERTEDLCKYSIIKNGIKESNIHIIKNIRPFSKALKKGYQLATKLNKKYTIFVDADHIILPNSLQILLNSAERYSDKLFFLNPLCYDYILKKIIPNGPHLYLTKNIKVAIKHIENESVSKRPETFVVNKMKDLGYLNIYLNIPVSLHEFAQYNKDIFYRVFNKYLKFDSKRDYLESFNSKTIEYEAVSSAKRNKNGFGDKELIEEEFKKLNIEELEPIKHPEAEYKKHIQMMEKLKNNYEFVGYDKSSKQSIFSKISLKSLFNN